DRPVADPFAVRQAAAADYRRAVEGAQELVRESRLPHTGRAGDREEVAGPLCGRARERVGEELLLALAPNHRRSAEPRGRRAASEQPVGDEWLALALRGERLDGLALDRVAHEPVGLLAEQDLARLGSLL